MKDNRGCRKSRYPFRVKIPLSKTSYTYLNMYDLWVICCSTFQSLDIRGRSTSQWMLYKRIDPLLRGSHIFESISIIQQILIKNIIHHITFNLKTTGSKWSAKIKKEIIMAKKYVYSCIDRANITGTVDAVEENFVYYRQICKPYCLHFRKEPSTVKDRINVVVK